MKAINWNEVESKQEGFSAPVPGGYICRIVQVEDVEDKEYLKLTLDICEGEFARRGEQIEESTGATWGYYTAYRSYKDSALGFFRNFLDNVDKSNKDFSVATFNNEEQKLKDKVIGVVLREEEYVGLDRETGANVKKVALRVYSLIPTEDIRAGKFKIPKLKPLDEIGRARLQESNNYKPFSAATDDVDLPF